MKSVGLILCSPTWFCSPRIENAILLLRQWPLVSLNQHRSCQTGLRSAQSLVFSPRRSWIIQIRAWEQMQFGKWPFCPLYQNLMFTVWGGKETGILGIPGMQRLSKGSFPSRAVHQGSLPRFCSTARTCKYKGAKTKPQSWSLGGRSNRGLHFNLSFNETKNLKAKNRRRLKVP